VLGYNERVIYEWDAAKALANERKHGVPFEEAQSVFLDPLAETFDDPDHSADEQRFITIGTTARQRLVLVAHAAPATTAYGSSVHAWQHAGNPMPTRNTAANTGDDLRPEYDLGKLKGGVRGKYYARATAGTTLVLLDRDVAEAFPDGTTVNEALRALIKVAETKVRGVQRAPVEKPPGTIRGTRKPKAKPRSRAARG
jgi:uncharacterized DUF497 family protein